MSFVYSEDAFLPERVLPLLPEPSTLLAGTGAEFVMTRRCKQACYAANPFPLRINEGWPWSEG